MSQKWWLNPNNGSVTQHYFLCVLLFYVFAVISNTLAFEDFNMCGLWFRIVFTLHLTVAAYVNIEYVCRCRIIINYLCSCSSFTLKGMEVLSQKIDPFGHVRVSTYAPDFSIDISFMYYLFGAFIWPVHHDSSCSTYGLSSVTSYRLCILWKTNDFELAVHRFVSSCRIVELWYFMIYDYHWLSP